MKVAVISAVPMCGKSTLIEILGGVYSRSQGRDVVVLSSGDSSDIINMVTNFTKNEVLDNPYIIKSMVENSSGNNKDLLNYGIQAGDEHVYIYNVMDSVMEQKDKEDFLIEAITKIPAGLSLIEICGDPYSEFNQRVYKECDCMLVLTDCSQKGIKAYKNLIENFPNKILKMNKALILSRLDANVASDKKLSELLGVKINEFYKFPYNAVVGKQSLNGSLDKVIYNILVADHEVVNLRMPMQELMEFMFNTPTRKIVRSIDRWYK